MRIFKIAAAAINLLSTPTLANEEVKFDQATLDRLSEQAAASLSNLDVMAVRLRLVPGVRAGRPADMRMYAQTTDPVWLYEHHVDAKLSNPGIAMTLYQLAAQLGDPDAIKRWAQLSDEKPTDTADQSKEAVR